MLKENGIKFVRSYGFYDTISEFLMEEKEIGEGQKLLLTSQDKVWLYDSDQYDFIGGLSEDIHDRCAIYGFGWNLGKAMALFKKLDQDEKKKVLEKTLPNEVFA